MLESILNALKGQKSKEEEAQKAKGVAAELVKSLSDTDKAALVEALGLKAEQPGQKPEEKQVASPPEEKKEEQKAFVPEQGKQYEWNGSTYVEVQKAEQPGIARPPAAPAGGKVDMQDLSKLKPSEINKMYENGSIHQMYGQAPPANLQSQSVN